MTNTAPATYDRSWALRQPTADQAETVRQVLRWSKVEFIDEAVRHFICTHPEACAAAERAGIEQEGGDQ